MLYVRRELSGARAATISSGVRRRFQYCSLSAQPATTIQSLVFLTFAAWRIFSSASFASDADPVPLRADLHAARFT